MSALAVHIVDDDPAIRQSLTFALEIAGLIVRSHATANDFLAVFPPDDAGAIISDVRMPGLSGIELTKRVARSGLAIPVVLMTGHSDKALKAEAIAAGAAAVLDKPVALEVLLGELRRVSPDLGA